MFEEKTLNILTVFLLVLSSASSSSSSSTFTYKLIQVDGTITVIASILADSPIVCVSYCQASATCWIVEYVPSMATCNILDINGLGRVSVGGIQVYADVNIPSMYYGMV